MTNISGSINIGSPSVPEPVAPIPGQKEDRSLKTSASNDKLIMDLFKGSREWSSGLDVTNHVKMACGIEDRSLKRADTKDMPRPPVDSSDDFLLQNALGSNARGAMGSGGQAGLGGDNFVLEWAYSVDPDDWKTLDHLNNMKNDTGSEGSGNDKSGGSAKASGGSNNNGSGTTPSTSDAGAKEDGDEEYIPEGESNGRGGRKRRAASRAVIKDEEGGSPDEDSKKRKCTWRKYGQKVLKGKDFVGMDVIRCYYRCNVRGCKVKKQVEKASWQTDGEAAVSVTGIHTHPYEEVVEGADDHDEPAGEVNTASAMASTRARNTRDPLPVPPLNTAFSNEIRESSPHFVISDPSKPDCPIIFASPGFCRLTGYSLAECVGRNCRFLQGRDTNPNAVRQISMACKLRKEIRVIILNYKKNGTPFWNLLHITPVEDQQGNLISFVGVQMDVSERYAGM